MWVKVENNKVVETIPQPRTMIVGSGDDAVKYSKGTVFEVWSDVARKAIGVLPLNILNSVDLNLYKPQSLDELDCVVNDNHVDGSYPLVPKYTLPKLKASLISQTRKDVSVQYRNVVDDEYAEKYRIESEGGTYEISEDIKAFASDLKTNFALYKEAINDATDVSALRSIRMAWPIV
jgi:hypothetical protein